MNSILAANVLYETSFKGMLNAFGSFIIMIGAIALLYMGILGPNGLVKAHKSGTGKDSLTQSVWCIVGAVVLLVLVTGVLAGPEGWLYKLVDGLIQNIANSTSDGIFPGS